MYKAKINKRKGNSGAVIRCHLVAEDSEGRGQATGVVDIPIIIKPEDGDDREACLRRKAKIDAALTTNNPDLKLVERVEGLKDSIGYDEGTKTTSILREMKLLDPQVIEGKEERITDYIDGSYNVIKHPVYTGGSDNDCLMIQIIIDVSKGDIIETITKTFAIERYTKANVVAALSAALAGRGKTILWDLIRDVNTDTNNCWAPITDQYLSAALTTDSVRITTSEGRSRQPVDTSPIFNVLKKYTDMSEESMPTFKLSWTWSTAPHGYSENGNTFKFIRPDVTDSIATNEITNDVTCSRDGNSAKFLVAKTITKPNSCFKAVIEYDENNSVLLETNQISIRTNNIKLADVEDNFIDAMKASWYGLDNNQYDNQIKSSGAQTVNITFGSNDYRCIKIPMSVLGLSQTSAEGQNIIPDKNNIGYTVKWSGSEPRDYGFGTNTIQGCFNVVKSGIDAGNANAVKITMDGSGTNNYSNEAFGFVLLPEHAKILGLNSYEIESNPGLVTAESEDNDVLTKSRLLDIGSYAKNHTEYVYLVFSKQLFTDNHIESVELSHKFTIQGGAADCNDPNKLSSNGFASTGTQYSIDNTVNFKISI